MHSSLSNGRRGTLEQRSKLDDGTRVIYLGQLLDTVLPLLPSVSCDLNLNVAST